MFVYSENILNYIRVGVILSHAKMVHSNELAQSVVKFDYVAIYNDVVKFNKSAILFMGKYPR